MCIVFSLGNRSNQYARPTSEITVFFRDIRTAIQTISAWRTSHRTPRWTKLATSPDNESWVRTSLFCYFATMNNWIQNPCFKYRVTIIFRYSNTTTLQTRILKYDVVLKSFFEISWYFASPIQHTRLPTTVANISRKATDTERLQLKCILIM